MRRIPFAGNEPRDRIAAQWGAVDELLVAPNEPKVPLLHQLLLRAPGARRSTKIVEAAGKMPQRAEKPLQFPREVFTHEQAAYRPRRGGP